jgi:hypothetical protein
MEQAVSVKKAEIIRQQQLAQSKTEREYLSKYLYEAGALFMSLFLNQFSV